MYLVTPMFLLVPSPTRSSIRQKRSTRKNQSHRYYSVEEVSQDTCKKYLERPIDITPQDGLSVSAPQSVEKKVPVRSAPQQLITPRKCVQERQDAFLSTRTQRLPLLSSHHGGTLDSTPCDTFLDS